MRFFCAWSKASTSMFAWASPDVDLGLVSTGIDAEPVMPFVSTFFASDLPLLGAALCRTSGGVRGFSCSRAPVIPLFSQFLASSLPALHAALCLISGGARAFSCSRAPVIPLFSQFLASSLPALHAALCLISGGARAFSCSRGPVIPLCSQFLGSSLAAPHAALCLTSGGERGFSCSRTSRCGGFLSCPHAVLAAPGSGGPTKPSGLLFLPISGEIGGGASLKNSCDREPEACKWASGRTGRKFSSLSELRTSSLSSASDVSSFVELTPAPRMSRYLVERSLWAACCACCAWGPLASCQASTSPKLTRRAPLNPWPTPGAPGALTGLFSRRFGLDGKLPPFSKTDGSFTASTMDCVSSDVVM